MDLHLNQDECQMLREVLQQRVAELDREIAATENSRFKRELRDTERSIERVLGKVTTAMEPQQRPPDSWEERDAVPDVDAPDLGRS
jgi:hypothetical protein